MRSSVWYWRRPTLRLFLSRFCPARFAVPARLCSRCSSPAYGGSGQRFDLEILKNIKLQRPFFLAGGLDAKNVHEALEAKPYAVDVSGGVETDGSKDFEKMRAFIAAVKGSREND